MNNRISNIIYDLKGVISRIDDTRELFHNTESDHLLYGMRKQACLLIDILRVKNGFDFNFDKLNHDANMKTEQEGDLVTYGRVLINKFIFCFIDDDELFEGMPSNEDIANKYEQLKYEDYFEIQKNLI